ncbi:MAG: lysophospholipase [Oscillospiraceae bacterium]
MEKELMFRSFDGTELYMKQTLPTAPKAAVLIVHGLCEHQGRYDYVAGRMQEGGLAVFRFDHRGHGRSGGKRVFYSDFNEIADDVHEAFKIMRAACPGLKLFVLGHSMGGYATALFGTKYPGLATGILLSGALTRYNHKLMGELPMPGSPEDYFDNALGDGVCSDPAVVKAYVNDPYVEKRISVGLCNSLGAGIAWLKANPAKFTCPVLVMHGANDGLVSERDSREFFGEIASKDKGLFIYPLLFHEILNEPCKDEIIADILRWVNRRL